MEEELNTSIEREKTNSDDSVVDSMNNYALRNILIVYVDRNNVHNGSRR